MITITHNLKVIDYDYLLSQILLWNPRGPVEQGNPNTCAEVKPCLFFIYADSRNSCCETEAFFYTVGFN